MSNLTTFKCDRCGDNRVAKSKYELGQWQLWQVEIRVSCGYTPDVNHSVDWCRKCCVEMGVLGPCDADKGVEKVDPPPTIEDLIRQIVREER